jgi:hypothetical protein
MSGKDFTTCSFALQGFRSGRRRSILDYTSCARLFMFADGVSCTAGSEVQQHWHWTNKMLAKQDRRE